LLTNIFENTRLPLCKELITASTLPFQTSSFAHHQLYTVMPFVYNNKLPFASDMLEGIWDTPGRALVPAVGGFELVLRSLPLLIAQLAFSNCASRMKLSKKMKRKIML